jgi:hypothetical protein
MNDKTKDRVERLVGLELDGRLDDSLRRELDAFLRDGEAARVRDEMVRLRETLRSVPDPVVPPLLRDRIVARVAVARDDATTPVLRLAGDAPLRLIQSIVAAAAIALGTTAWVASGGAVRADDRLEHPRTIEDDLRERTDQDGSVDRFLEWRFLGAER